MAFDNVIAHLKDEMKGPFTAGNRSDVVVLLGAGCSCQYGLPSFQELLTNLYCDIYPRRQRPDSTWSTSSLRDELNDYFRDADKIRMREMLSVYLKLVNGKHCLGYRRLARLIKNGRIKAVVNLNFDTLLEEALEAEGFADEYLVSTTFTARARKKFVLIKPHGSIGPVHRRGSTGDILALDLANTELFHQDERRAANSLLSNHVVVLLGYSGVDGKIVDALLPSGHRAKKRLFVINVDRPSGTLIRAIYKRRTKEGGTTDNLSVLGEEAAFENFMEHLEASLSPDVSVPVDERDDARLRRLSTMTRSERNALARCLKAAVQLRLSLNVAERSKISIEEHGLQVFSSCLKIAKNAGICLNSIEKYSLHCVAYLHDLGYFNGYARGRVAENPGWRLLCEHGAQTADMLREQFRQDSEFLRSMIPQSYGLDERSERRFGELICDLCRSHTGLLADEVMDEDPDFLIAGVSLSVRLSLLITLFALAEDISDAHPFLPSADAVDAGEAGEAGRHGSIIDPVLDLYLKPKHNRLKYRCSKGRISGEILQRDRPALTHWLTGMTAYHIARFNRECGKVGWVTTFDLTEAGPRGPGIAIAPAAPRSLADIKDLLRKALEETLKLEVQAVSRHADHTASQISERESLLDLVAVYTLPQELEVKREPSEWVEPRVSLLRSPAVERALKHVEGFARREEEEEWPGVLSSYLALARSDESKRLRLSSKMFLYSYEGIIYPAWRFFARNWHDGIEAVLMARTCLDLGSSGYRGEVADGLSRLLTGSNGYIEWLGGEGREACGHNQCTLCTARLLYILSRARLHLAFRRRPWSSGVEERIDEAIRGFLRYLGNRKPDESSWWGFGGTKDSDHDVRSVDYLAWVPRAIACCLSVDREIEKTRGVQWLDGFGVPRADVESLLAQRCEYLFATGPELLSYRAEEPFSYVIGHVATAYLHLMRLTRKLDMPVLEEERVNRKFAAKISAAAERVGDVSSRVRKGPRALSQMSRFNLWPALLLRSLLNPHDREIENALVELCTTCVFSRIWIHHGPETGSWGFNVKNTQSIVSSLVDFWGFALAKSRAHRFTLAFERAKHAIAPLLDDV